mgnify:CR=1 FL=1
MTRVLIADDDPRITEIHQHYVNKVEGFEVIGLSNTLEDTEMQIRVMEPQLLLLDIYFPDGSGIDLLKQVRQQSKALDIIPITAGKEVRLLQEAMRGGVFDYILKPVVFPRFEQTLKRYRNHRLKFQSLESLEQSQSHRRLAPPARGAHFEWTHQRDRRRLWARGHGCDGQCHLPGE